MNRKKNINTVGALKWAQEQGSTLADAGADEAQAADAEAQARQDLNAAWADDPLILGAKQGQGADVRAALAAAAAAASDAEAMAVLRDRLAERIPAHVTARGDDERDLSEREWLIPGWLPAGRAGIIVGRGGAGKSTLALQLAASLASDEPRRHNWLPARDPNQGAMDEIRLAPSDVVIASWEDEPVEIQRRRKSMVMDGLTHLHSRHVAGRLHVLDMRRRGPVWAPRGASKHTSTMADLTRAGEAVRAYCEKIQARLLVLDPLAAANASSEIDRALVRAFMADWDGWGSDAGCAVALIAHPSRSASPEDPWSGSTDWHSASRWLWRIWLEDTDRKKGKRDRDKQPDKAMKLTLAKASYGPPRRHLWLRRVQPKHGKWGTAWETCTAEKAAAAFNGGASAGGSSLKDSANSDWSNDDTF